jgi:hypothetical protein
MTSAGVIFVTDDPLAKPPDPADGFIRLTPDVIAQLSRAIQSRRDAGEFNEGGVAAGDGYSLDVGGNCPVQGQGLVDGLPAYFRARHSSWQLSIANDPDGDPVMVGTTGGPLGWWHRENWPGGEHDAGWMNFGQAEMCIATAVALYRNRPR